MIQKQCSNCKKEKPISEFNKHIRGLYKTRSDCKVCQRIYYKKYYEKRYANDEKFRQKKKEYSIKWAFSNPEKRARIARQRNIRAIEKCPEKIKARALINQRVRFKRMPRASDLLCFRCGNKAKHYHHHNGYSFEFRYDVVPVCIACHNKLD